MTTGRGLTILELSLLVTGVALLLFCGAALVHRSVACRKALFAFDQAADAQRGDSGKGSQAVGEADPDFTLWSEKRVRAYRESLVTYKGAPLAVLSMPKFGIRVPVLEGTDEISLNRGVGWIAGTARPGESGNVGIAGHRDGFFRGLEDVQIGDSIEVATLRGKRTYLVEQLQIVNPEDVGVLKPRAASSVTLVTCYPFYFVGDAPQRLAIHAKQLAK